MINVSVCLSYESYGKVFTGALLEKLTVIVKWNVFHTKCIHFQRVAKVNWGQKSTLPQKVLIGKQPLREDLKNVFVKKSYPVKYTRRKVYFSGW